MEIQQASRPGGTSRSADPAGLRRPVAERWTFEQLHEAYFPDLTRFVTRRIRDRELACEIVQETFLRAYRARRTFEPDRPAWPWLATIARNLIINTIRDEHRRRAHVQTVDWDEIAGTADPRDEIDPETSFTTTQRRRAITIALRSLAPRQRRILLLRAAEGLSYEDIAAREGVSIDAVKSLLKRARRAFREAYGSNQHGRQTTLSIPAL